MGPESLVFVETYLGRTLRVCRECETDLGKEGALVRTDPDGSAEEIGDSWAGTEREF
jgi:hypothetical protein